MKQVILIGGTPTVGKSTVAKALSEKLGIPWISTDQLRGIIRPYAKREEYPDLLLPEGSETAEDFLTRFSAEEIADMELAQAKDVWPAVKYLIEEKYGWKNGVIIEGVNITPELVHEYKDQKHIKAIFLVDEDADRMRDIVYSRGLWDSADTYSDDLKPKEIEWAMLFSHKLKLEAEKFGYPCIEVEKDSNDLQRVVETLKI